MGLNGFVDLNALRDGFYKDNNFVQNDIMMVLKPTSVGKDSDHSTYSNDILGEVVGVPDIKLNAEEIMPAAIKAKIEGKGISEKTSSIAPYGGAVSTAVKSVTKPSTEKAQVITEQDLEILYPEKAQKDNITEAQVQKVLKTDKTAQRIIAKGINPKQGENVGIRLNLNVFKNTGVPVQSIHKGTKTDAFKKVDGTSGNFRGEVINYAPAVTLKDVYLNTHQKSIYEVKNKIKNKFPLASVDGKFQNIPFDKQNLTGTEVRFNPFNTQLFETLDGKPVRFVEEATVSGTRVFARGKIYFVY